MEGFAALRGRVHIHDGDGRPHQRPDIREAPLRFSDLYARVWTVLGRSALGREVRLRRHAVRRRTPHRHALHGS